MALNHDATLHVDLRKRAKRAAEELGAPPAAAAEPAPQG
jgi:hypothetical protein